MSGTVSPFVPASEPFGPLSLFSPAQLQVMLQQAVAARHTLMINQSPTVVLYSAGEGSRSVTYSKTSLPTLNNYIDVLSRACGMRGRRGAIVL
ncbi:MAG: gpW family head-tail joining protein [Janthinobacterium lividum]